MVWAGISIEGRTDLHVIDGGALTGIKYRDEILHPTVRPFDFIWMDDNARPHRALAVNDYMEQKHLFVWSDPVVHLI